MPGHLLGHFESLRELRARGGRLGGAVHLQCERIELRRNSDQSLRQRVVNLAGHARALLQDQRESPPDLLQAKLIEGVDSCEETHHAERDEPGLFVKMRKDFEIERGFARWKAGHRSPNYKPVMSGTQRAVAHDTA